jgi:hypothetical protein
MGKWEHLKRGKHSARGGFMMQETEEIVEITAKELVCFLSDALDYAEEQYRAERADEEKISCS